MSNTVRILRSTTAGNVPSSLVSGQIAVNEADGRFFYRSAAGAVTAFSPVASFATIGSFPAVGAANVLYLAQDSSRVYQWSGVYVEVGVASGFDLPAATTSSLGGVVVGTGLSVASGTVSANVVSVAGRTGAVVISSADVSGLPTAGTGSANYCAGDDARLTNSRTPTSHASSHAAAGSDPLTLSAAQVSGLATVATSGSAADLSGTLADARLSTAVALHSQINTTLGQASGVIDSVPRATAAAGVTAGAGQAIMAFFTPVTTITVSQIAMSNGTGAVAAGLTLARMGIYTYPTEGGTATLVARTASDTSLFAATNTTYTRSLDTAGGYPSTYTLNAGTRYGVAYICVGTTQPQLIGRTVLTAVGVLPPRLSGGSTTGLSDLPASFTPNQNSQAPFARLS